MRLRIKFVVCLMLAAGACFAAVASADEPQSERLPTPSARDQLLRHGAPDETPQLADFESKPLSAITTNIRPTDGDLPENVAARRFAEVETVTGIDSPRFNETVFFWQASNLAHRPLRFEQAYVERYGYNYGLLQPVVSGVEFYGDVALLPIKWVAKGPRQCIYTLGTGRPGSYGVPCPRY